MPAANLLTEWAKLLFASFADAGIEDVVISPGSRSTPFVVAAVRERRLQCHSVIDERAAGFFALGQARLTQRPTVLLCTSGTAGAHYLPAIIEAGAAFLPLLVLTADRPTELQHCAAPQTIDQINLYGGHVRRFFELGMPDPRDKALVALRRMVAQATFHCLHPTPGAVHLNVRARKPLEPAPPGSDEDRNLADLARRIASAAISLPAAPLAAPDPAAIRAAAVLCREARRGLIICGPAPARLARERDALFELARATGFPVAAEATSQVRFGPLPNDVVIMGSLDTLFRSAAFCQSPPDVVVQIGVPPVAGGWERFADTCTARRVILSEHGWADPPSTASLLAFGEPIASLRALTSALAEAGPAPSELTKWSHFVAAADAVAWQAVDLELGATTEAFSEGHALRVLASELPSASVLVVGNSLAVRLIDTFCAKAATVTVLSQRGTSGIEGLIAGAAGSATKSGAPVTLVLGDVSFVHDLTSLILAQRAAVPLVVLVLQNGGGRIFEQLPLASAVGLEPEILDLTTTPHTTDVSHAAAAFGVDFVRVGTDGELREALRHAYTTPGCTVVEAIAPPHGAAQQHRRIWATANAAIERLRERSPQ